MFVSQKSNLCFINMLQTNKKKKVSLLPSTSVHYFGLLQIKDNNIFNQFLAWYPIFCEKEIC